MPLAGPAATAARSRFRSLGAEFAKAVRGVPDGELALPFTDPAPIVAHALLRRLAPLMLMVYRRRDAREIS